MSSPSSISLQLLCAPSVRLGETSWPLPAERRGQLIVLLALRRAWVGRAELAALLWPEQESRLALANLRKTLFRLDALPFALGLQTQGAALRLDVDTDVAAFEAAIAGQREADALRLYCGDLLAGFDPADPGEGWAGWLAFERDRHRTAWRGAALARLAGEIDAAEAIELSARLLAADPLDEAALRAHLEGLARAGQAARARQVWREFVERMDRELGIAPGAELRALHDRLGSAAAVPVAAPAARRFDDGFIGRSVELRRIAELLQQPGCRLLTLVGPGGVGKTRLARRALAELAPHHRDGAVFVALEDVSGAAGLGARLARELGVARLGNRAAIDAAIGAIGTQRMLLVLDNVEQLAAEAAVVERLIDACPALVVIATSRVRLALGSETVLPVEGLPTPEAEDHDRIEAFDATRLFIAAARRVQPALAVVAEAEAIVEICRRVEGLPLAIELAAAWTRVLSCAAIAAELARGPELLRAQDAAHPARHASIEAVFEQSWQLLGSTERDVLARLAVFRGGFTPEAARAVAGASWPVLGALVDHSLLRKDGARLHLHPLVQKLAAARLGEHAEAAREAHARHFLRLIVASRRGARYGEAAALARIDADVDNCRNAWRWAIRHGDADALRAGAWTLLHYCDLRGRYADGLRLLNEAQEGAAAGHAALEAVLLAATAHVQSRLDRYDDAEATARRVLADPRHADADARVQALKVLGACAMRRDRFAAARRYWQRTLRLSAGDLRTEASMLDNLSVAENLLGRKEAALEMAARALTQHRAIGDAAGEAYSLNQIGTLQTELGRFDAARVNLLAALALCDRHRLVGPRAFVLGSLNVNAHDAGDLDGAQAWAEQTLEVARAAGNRLVEAAMLMQFARIHARRGDRAAAGAALRAGLQIGIGIGSPELGYIGIGALADVLDAQGERGAAQRLLGFIAAHPGISARLRFEFEARQARLGTPATPWAGGDVQPLVHRIAAGTDDGFAALISELRAPA